MSTDTIPLKRPKQWLVVAGILSVLAIAVLWPLQTVGQVCILIYPAPPGCGAEEPRWVPLVAIGLVVAAFAAIVVVYFTVEKPTRALAALTITIVAIVLIAAAVVALSQTGVWDPAQPPIIVD